MKIQFTHIFKLDNEDGEFVEVWKLRQKKSTWKYFSRYDNVLIDLRSKLWRWKHTQKCFRKWIKQTIFWSRWLWRWFW